MQHLFNKDTIPEGQRHPFRRAKTPSQKGKDTLSEGQQEHKGSASSAGLVKIQ